LPLDTPDSFIAELPDVIPDPLPFYVENWPWPRGKEYAALFYQQEQKYGMPNMLLANQAYAESGFRPDVIDGRTVSSANAVGIMQIVVKWHPGLAAGDAVADRAVAVNPSLAIPYAAKYLNDLRKQFGSWKLALAAYNWGPGNLAKQLRGPYPAETVAYVRKITGEVLA
jgi:soluble lytic murein transglycosylase-like protein